MALPGGVVTFVFSDIEGSTKLWESDPEGMRISLSHHDEIVRSIVEAANGSVFKHTGDGFGAAFDSATAGLEAAARVAAALTDGDWEGPALTCRMAVHSGDAEPTDGDYFGTTVTRTARLMDAGNGGQILVSEATRRLLGDGQPSGDALESLRTFTAMPGDFADGWREWHTGMAHLQLGDVDQAVAGFAAPGAYDPDLPTAYDRANVGWFWSIVAERRGEHRTAAVLLGFAEALSEKASVRLKAFDQRLVEESRSAVLEALGENAYGELIEQGARMAWEDLPLVHR
jgi:class 3 adenylate cyclase